MTLAVRGLLRGIGTRVHAPGRLAAGQVLPPVDREVVGAREGPVAGLADVRPVPCVPPVVPLQFVAASKLPAAGVPVADVRLLACGMKESEILPSGAG